MATAKNGTDLVPVTDYSIVQASTEDLAEIIQENIGGALNQFDLDRIGMPAGGGQTWTVPTLEGEEDRKAIEGIIVYWKEPRAYWTESFDASGGGTPPDCSSPDGYQGTGLFGPGSEHNPTGECAKCPMSQWGSDDRNRGQACKQMRVLFMVQPEDMLPVAVVLPPTSIRPMKKYMLRLASRSIPYWGVITRIELTREKNADGINYSVANPSLGSRLTPDQAEEIKHYSHSIRAALDSVVVNVAATEYSEAAAASADLDG